MRACVVTRELAKYRNVFKRVETDAEFINRIGFQYVTISTPKMVPSFYGPYEVVEHNRVHIRTLAGKALDDAVWECFKMQRRIIEDVSN